MEVYMTEEWSSIKSNQGMRVHNPHFNFELSSPACNTTFNVGSKLHITVLKILGILENSLYQMT
jgi:hypothetical protein